MGHTYTKLIVHVVFSTKDRLPFLHQDRRPDVFSYMGGILRALHCEPLQINGMADHAHLAFTIPAAIPLAKVVGLVKGNTTRWCHESGIAGHSFAWQRGYSAFSVSASNLGKVTKYIANQEAHHRKATFQEELIRFYKRHGIDYDDRYCWD